MITEKYLGDHTWIIHRRNKDRHKHYSHVTSVIRVLSPGKVAIARSYCAKHDKFSPEKGAAVAVSRMNELLKRHLANKRNVKYRRYVRQHHLYAGWCHTIFEVLNPVEMADAEYSFYSRIISPKMLKEFYNGY